MTPWRTLLGILGGISPCWRVCPELHGALPPATEGESMHFQMPPRSPFIRGQRDQSVLRKMNRDEKNTSVLYKLVLYFL